MEDRTIGLVFSSPEKSQKQPPKSEPESKK